MTVFSNESRLQVLRNLLLFLSKMEISEIKNLGYVSKQLKKIYSVGKNDTWKHTHSDIFSTVVYIDNSKNGYDIHYLGQNIAVISKWNNDGKIDSLVFDAVKKLCDHVQLDIARIDYVKQQMVTSVSQSSETQNQIKTITNQIEEFKNEAEKSALTLKNDVKAWQRETITILGIFAAIVISFTGGLVFSSSVLENINKSSMSRLILVISGIGFVLFNIIWVLLEFIRSINGQKIARGYIWWIINSVFAISSMMAIFCPSLFFSSLLKPIIIY